MSQEAASDGTRRASAVARVSATCKRSAIRDALASVPKRGSRLWGSLGSAITSPVRGGEGSRHAHAKAAKRAKCLTRFRTSWYHALARSPDFREKGPADEDDAHTDFISSNAPRDGDLRGPRPRVRGRRGLRSGEPALPAPRRTRAAGAFLANDLRRVLDPPGRCARRALPRQGLQGARLPPLPRRRCRVG